MKKQLGAILTQVTSAFQKFKQDNEATNKKIKDFSKKVQSRNDEKKIEKIKKDISQM